MDPLDVRRNRPAETNTKTPLRETGSQTAGPYVHIGCLPNFVGIQGIYPADLTSNGNQATGHPLRLTGQIFEGEGIICKDVMLEIWHADGQGDYTNGIWQRSPTDLETGLFTFETIKPGATLDSEGRTLAPFITLWIVARGINIGLVTRIYFANEEAANNADPHLALIEESRRKTLIATPTENENEYHLDIHLQGEAETVFFDI